MSSAERCDITKEAITGDHLGFVASAGIGKWNIERKADNLEKYVETLTKGGEIAYKQLLAQYPR